MLTASQDRTFDAEAVRERIQEEVFRFIKQHSGSSLARRGCIAANLGYSTAVIGGALKALSGGGVIRLNGVRWEIV